MAETTGDIIIMNTTGRKNPFPVSQPQPSLPDHIAKAVGKAKNISGSMKSTRSTRSLGGISIFMDPETADSLPRDVEMTMSMYELEKDAGGRSNGDPGTSSESKTEISHVEVNGDIYATVTKKTKTVKSAKTKDKDLVNGDADDANSFVFTSELAGEGKTREINSNGLVGAEPGGKKSSAVTESISSEKGTSKAVINSTTTDSFNVETHHGESQKASSESQVDDNKGLAIGGPETQVNTAGVKTNSATDVHRAGSFQLKSAYSGDTQRMVSSPSSNSLHDTDFRNNLSDTLTRKVAKSRADQQQAQSVTSSQADQQQAQSVTTSSSQSVSTPASKQEGGTPTLSSDHKSVSVTKREIVGETSTSSGQSGVVSRQKEVKRTGSAASRPTSQASYQSLSKTVYGVYGKGAKDGSKAVGRSNSRSTSSSSTKPGTTTYFKTETSHSSSGDASGVARNESTRSEVSTTGVNNKLQQVSRASSKASSQAEVRPSVEKTASTQSVSRTSSLVAESSLKSPTTTTTVTKVSDTSLKSPATTTTVTKVFEVERSSSKASDSASSIIPASLVSSQSSLSTLKHSDSQRSAISSQVGKSKYYAKSDPAKSYGSSTSLQRSISQRSDAARASEPASVSSSISSLARRYSSKEIKAGDSSTNVSTVTDISIPSQAASEITLQEDTLGKPTVGSYSETTVTTTTTTTTNEPEAKDATPHGIKKLKSELMKSSPTTDSNNKPSASLANNKAFKAELSSLFGAGPPADSSASAPTSLARSKQKKQLYTFESDQDIRLSANYRGLSSASRDADDAENEYESQTFPRTTGKDSKIVSSTPTSPIYEIQQTVKAGNVGKLVKDVFWNLPLTGRSLDATLEKKPKKVSEPKKSGEVSPQADDNEEGEDGKKKYKFLVEGIDIPAVETEENTENPHLQASNTHLNVNTTEHHADKPDGSTEQPEEPQSGTLKRDYEKKGFGYILDKKLQSEIKKRADNVTKKRPHEKVEESVQVHRKSTLNEPESDLYKDAKAKLHKQESSVEVFSDDDTQDDSDFLKEIRSKLNKQRSRELVVEQQTSHDHSHQTVVHAPVRPDPVNTESAFRSEMNAKNDLKSKELAKRSTEPTNKAHSHSQAQSHTKTSIDVDVKVQNSPISPDSAYQSDPNLSPVMGTEIDPQPSTSFDLKAGGKSHKVTLEDLGPPEQEAQSSALLLTDSAGHNGSETQYESEQRLVRQTKTLTTTTTSDFENPQGKKQLQETKSDWTAERSTVVKSGGKQHKDSSFLSESRESRNFVGGDNSLGQSAPDSRAIEAEPQPLSQLDIINAALTSQDSSYSRGPKYSETVAKSAVAEPHRGNELGTASVTQKESGGERRTKDTETKILIQDSVNYNRSLQADSSSKETHGGGKGRILQVAHSVGEDAPPEIVVDTVETPRDFDNTHRFNVTSGYTQHSADRGIQSQPRLGTSDASPPSPSSLNRSYHDVRTEQDTYRSQNRVRHRPDDNYNHAGKIIQLKPLAVDVSHDRHLEMRTHPSVSNLDVSPPPPALSGRNTAYTYSPSSSPYGPISPQSDASGSVWLNNPNSPYPTMQSTANQSSYTKEYREVNNNETYRYDVGIENIPSTKRFLKVDELSSGKMRKYNNRDIKVHHDANRQQITTRPDRSPLDNYPNGMDFLDGRGDTNDRRGNYQVHKVMQQRMGREVYSQPIDTHPDMQYNKQKFYTVSQENLSPQGSRMTNTGGISTGTGPGYSDTLRSVEIDAVDPELQDASTDGSNYHITLKLNPHGHTTTSRPASKASHYDRDNYEETQRYSSNNHTLLHSPTGPGHHPRSDSSNSNQQRKIRVLSSSSAGSADYNNRGHTDGHSHFVMMNVRQGPTYARGQYNSDTVDGYSSGAELYGTGTSGVSTTSANGPPPRFTMAIDQTMTLDYVPKEHEQPQPPPPLHENVEPGRHKANIYLADSRKVETNTYFEPEPTPLQTSRVYVSGDDEPDRARGSRTGRMTKMSTQRTYAADDLAQYMSPTEDVDYDTDDDDMPHFVRGSILIKNSMDTIGAPKVIDVVEGEDSEEEFVVEDNTNPFHGKFFQLRENPMYNSDQDLSQMKDETDYVYHKKSKQPAFTKIFDQRTERVVNGGVPNDGSTEIKVTRGKYNYNLYPKHITKCPHFTY